MGWIKRGGSTALNDSTPSTISTYSSEKIESLIQSVSTGGGGGTPYDDTDVRTLIKNTADFSAAKPHTVEQLKYAPGFLKAPSYPTDDQLKAFLTSGPYQVIFMYVGSTGMVIRGTSTITAVTYDSTNQAYNFTVTDEHKIVPSDYNTVQSLSSTFMSMLESYFTAQQGLWFFPDGMIVDQNNYKNYDWATEYANHTAAQSGNAPVDLTDYYTKEETFSQNEVQNLVLGKEDKLTNRPSLDRLIVDAGGKFYIDGNEFKPATDPPDLSPYYTKTDVDTKDSVLQAQITSLGAGMTFKGTVATRAALMAVTGSVKGDTWVINADEGNGNGKTLNVYDGSSYIYLGSFSVTAGATILDSSNVSTTNTWSAQKIYNSLTTKGDKTVVDSNTTRITALESKTSSGIPKYNTVADLPVVGSMGDTAVVIAQNALYEFGQGVDTTKDILPKTSTGATVAWGDGTNFVITAFNNGSGGAYHYNAFDDSISSAWVPGVQTFPQWLSLDLGKARAVGGFSLVPYVSGGNYYSWLKDFAVYASATGTFTGEEVKIFEVIGESKATNQNKRIYLFDRVYTTYRYFRIVITSVQGNGLSTPFAAAISEMELFGPGWGLSSMDADTKVQINTIPSLTTRLGNTEKGHSTTYPSAITKVGQMMYDTNKKKNLIAEAVPMIPVLASGTDQGFTVTSPTGVASPYSLFDQNLTTFSAMNANGELVIQFPVTQSIIQFHLEGSTNSSFNVNNTPMTFQIYGSNDGTTYTLLGDYNNPYNLNKGDNKLYFQVTSPGMYSYYKLKFIDDLYTSNTLNHIGGIQLYGGKWVLQSSEMDEMGVVDSLLPIFQSDTQDGVKITGDAPYAPDRPGWKVADGDLNSYYMANNSAIATGTPVNLTVAFTQAQLVKKIGLVAFNTNYPVDFTLYGSNDGGTTWTSVLSVTGNTAWSNQTMRYWDVTTPGSYRMYKFACTKVPSGFCEIVSLDLLGDTKKKAIKKTTDSFTLTAGANKVLAYTGEVICQVLVDLGSGNYRALKDSDNVAVSFGSSGVTIINNGAASINLKSFIV